MLEHGGAQKGTFLVKVANYILFLGGFLIKSVKSGPQSFYILGGVSKLARKVRYFEQKVTILVHFSGQIC